VLALLVVSFKFAKKMCLGIVFLISCLIISANLVAYANASSESGSISITAVIEPTRYILINSNRQITEVVSNTRELVTPLVILNSFNGPEQNYTTNIALQYQRILAGCKFQNNTGIIYNLGKCTYKTALKPQQTKVSIINIISILELNRSVWFKVI
jgi:hypothetical protein